MPVLKYYKKLLGIDYVLGTNPIMKDDKIDYIDESCFDNKEFKFESCKEIIKKLNIDKENIYAIGDSISDIKILSLAKHTFAIAPKSGIEKYANTIIKENMIEIINYLKS